MKAYNLHAVGDLRYEDCPRPECPKGWAIVRVKAAGICSSDVPRILTKGTYHFPTIPGHEFAGIVDDVADEENRTLIGQHVGVFPLIPCRNCPQCRQKHYEMCEHYDYIGSRRDGGFAEFVAVPVWNLIVLPQNLPFTAAAMLEPLSVALHAMKLGHITPGASVGIVGTGMIGIAAGQWAKLLGADRVTVIGRNETKRTMVEHCGLNYTTDSTSEYDFVLEAVGTPAAIASAIASTRPGGRLVLMGNPSGDITLPQNVYWRILRKQLSLAGTWNSAYDGTAPSDWTEAVNALAQGRIDVTSLATHIYPQDRLREGLELMASHREAYCKVMTLWNENN